MDDRRRSMLRVAGVACGALLVAGTFVGLRTTPSDELNVNGTDATGTASAPTTINPNGNEANSLNAAPSTTTIGLGSRGSADSASVAGGSAVAKAGTGGTTSPGAVSDGTVGAPLPSIGQPKIVKNATVRLEVKKGGFRGAFDAAASAAAAHGGFVVSSDSSVQKGETSTGSLVLRVPSDAFDAVRADLSKLGTIKDEHLTGQDVSGQLVDLDARIRSLQAQEDAVRALMSKARTIGETIEIQGQLTQVRQQIEQLSGEKARLDNAAALATLRLELFEPGAVPVQPPKPKSETSPLRHSITAAAHGAETVASGTIIVLGWVVPLGLLMLVAFGLWRLVGGRRRPATTEAGAA
jgi:hypothetical protein